MTNVILPVEGIYSFGFKTQHLIKTKKIIEITNTP